TWIPWMVSSVSSRFCAAIASRVQLCSWRWVANPPWAATCCASDGAFRTTSIRWPTSTLGRAPPTRPRHDEACEARERTFGALIPNPAKSKVAAMTIAAGIRSLNSDSLGVRIEGKITGVRDCVRVPGCGGDHRRVVGAQRERRGDRVRQGGAKLRVGRDAADACEALGAGLLGRLERPPGERADERALGAR